MTYRCTCGAPASTDDKTCQHCGKPFAPEEESEEQYEELPWERLDVFHGALFYSTWISAGLAVTVHDFIGSATLRALLLSFGASVCAGFCAVMLFQWKYPRGIYFRSLARYIGTITGLSAMIIALALSGFGSLTEYPDEFLAVAVAYIGALPVDARTTPWMTPELHSALVRQTGWLSFGAFHVTATTLGGLVGMVIYYREPKKGS